MTVSVSGIAAVDMQPTPHDMFGKGSNRCGCVVDMRTLFRMVR